MRLSVLLLLVPYLLIGGCSLHSGKPNIILVVVDDLGAHDVGFMGSTFYETPNIDKLAGGGVVFAQAYAAAANCSPTRASIMTGKYPARLGITDWIRPSVWRDGTEDEKTYVSDPGKKLACPHYPLKLDTAEMTIAELLKSAGYTTMHIGKWHLGGPGYLPEDQGFDYNFAGFDFGQPPSYYAPYTSDWAPGGIPSIMPLSGDEYLTDREAEEAVRFIRANRKHPFFLNLWHYAVHTPIQPEVEYEEYFKSKSSTDGQKNPRYAAMIKSVDDAMGRVMETLEEEGLIENTLVIFYSDNGGHNGYTSNAPLRSGKGNPWEGGIREPLVMHWPKVLDAGTEFTGPVSSIDLLPTLCNVAGVGVPENIGVDGVNIMPALLDDQELSRDGLFWHFPHYRSYEDVRPFSIVQSGDWKLIRFWEGSNELYNLADDPSETDDLSSVNVKKVLELESMLDSWLLETGALVPRVNPEYVEDLR
jgi:arylsulfatase A-like enzyme